jgi:hypothetical protein
VLACKLLIAQALVVFAKLVRDGRHEGDATSALLTAARARLLPAMASVIRPALMR